MTKPKRIFCLMGPTASNKTQLACELLELFPLEIISVDSAMIYQGMNIGTAKPSAAILATYPHHLVDILNPSETYSAAQFCKDVHALIDDILIRGKFPLLVGGTMMYFNALQQGLSSLPQADIGIRNALLERAAKEGWLALHKELMQVDPATALKVHPHDTQRLQRALEVYHLTGTPLSRLCEAPKDFSDYQFINFVLLPEERSALHQRIGLRFQEMLDNDLIGEVIHLLQTWSLKPDYPSMRSVGYRQVIEYLEGKYDQRQLFEKGAAATRQLAKRQLTWLRHWSNALQIESDHFPTVKENLISRLQYFLKT